MLNFFYPPYCFYCQQRREQREIFCADCQIYFSLIDPDERCPYCFTENEGTCPTCIQERRWSVKIASALEHIGAVGSFVEEVRKGRMVKTASSFLTLQFLRLRWPTPDLVVPIRGRGSSTFVKAFAKGLRLRYSACVGRRKGDLPQMRLPYEERLLLSKEHFYLKKEKIEGKKILIVDDTIGSAATIRAVAALLAQERPARIYALTLSMLSLLPSKSLVPHQ